jgi:hypothetical protein
MSFTTLPFESDAPNLAREEFFASAQASLTAGGLLTNIWEGEVGK